MYLCNVSSILMKNAIAINALTLPPHYRKATVYCNVNSILRLHYDRIFVVILAIPSGGGLRPTADCIPSGGGLRPNADCIQSGCGHMCKSVVNVD